MPISLPPPPPVQSAAPLSGTTPRGLEDWKNAVRSAPGLEPTKIGAEKAAPSPAPTVPLLTEIANTRDGRDPDRPLGRNLSVSTPVPVDSPVVPGGKVTTRFGNVDQGIAADDPGNSPQIDVRVFDRDGGAAAALRVRRDTGTVSGSVRASDGRTELVVGGTANPQDASLSKVQATLYRDALGVRVQLDNPGGGRTATGAVGAEGARVELIATQGGTLYPSGSSLQKGVEAYVFHAERGVPGSLAGSVSNGAGLRLNDIQISPKGAVPVTGAATLEVGDQVTTTRKGQRTEGLVVTADADLRIGKAGGVQGILQPFVTYSPSSDTPVSGGVFGGVTIQLK